MVLRFKNQKRNGIAFNSLKTIRLIKKKKKMFSPEVKLNF